MADLRKQYQSVSSEIESAVQAVLASGGYTLGENVKTLETDVARHCDAEYGRGVNSGTDALLLALSALGVDSGDEVITTPFTFVATTEVIALLGATPVYADIDLHTFNIDPNRIEEKITERTKAILPVHLYGQPADVSRIREIADRHGLKVVWDGAQAIGAKAHGMGVGHYGDAVTLSFFPTKNLGAAGDGGMVLTNNDELAEKIRFIRAHGSAGTYYYKYIGHCSRLHEVQAAVLRAKLPRLDEWTEARRRNARKYLEKLQGLDIILPITESVNTHVYHQFTIRTKDRDRLKEHLASMGISTGVYYPSPIHLEEAYRYLGYTSGDFPEAERACREVLSLPVFPEMTEEQSDAVVRGIRSFYEDGD